MVCGYVTYYIGQALCKIYAAKRVMYKNASQLVAVFIRVTFYTPKLFRPLCIEKYEY